VDTINQAARPTGADQVVRAGTVDGERFDGRDIVFGGAGGPPEVIRDDGVVEHDDSRCDEDAAAGADGVVVAVGDVPGNGAALDGESAVGEDSAAVGLSIISGDGAVLDGQE